MILSSFFFTLILFHIHEKAPVKIKLLDGNTEVGLIKECIGTYEVMRDFQRDRKTKVTT